MHIKRQKIFKYDPPDTPLGVVYLDDDVLAVSKPSGLLSVPGKPADHDDCLERRVRRAYPGARIVHRLDLGTSGLVVFARHVAALRSLSLQFEKRQTKKKYIARVWGIVEERRGEVDLPLCCDWPNRPRQMVSMEYGRPSRTEWEVLEYEKNVTRVALYPITGRSHQLRVHMMTIGHPILGDEFYAHDEAFDAAARLQLHAQELTLFHPESGAEHRFVDPCPF